jgi:hypothetical protein
VIQRRGSWSNGCCCVTSIGSSFERYAAFIRANPNWPSIPLLRRRAETRLWQEERGANTVRRFFGEKQPTSAVGRLALARELLGEGDRERRAPAAAVFVDKSTPAARRSITSAWRWRPACEQVRRLTSGIRLSRSGG